MEGAGLGRQPNGFPDMEMLTAAGSPGGGERHLPRTAHLLPHPIANSRHQGSVTPSPPTPLISTTFFSDKGQSAKRKGKESNTPPPPPSIPLPPDHQITYTFLQRSKLRRHRQRVLGFKKLRRHQRSALGINYDTTAHLNKLRRHQRSALGF
jgi:hypothetical protein